ncbi:hypothetical protein HBH70_209860 [Parastagonospora nodorum]|nr:hypothetical protein HBH52_167420 [Parastagonospora nodorum]KAH4047668.1 hypothetical protein HBH49_168190 [Parastagonospora nodorum]KAH4086543.1 hypothetical protein HBH46_204570 [Parastagonospora nodorum]KAH4116596.1 hypothetical protein HBH47_165070 [Parastagonospora nodorum]KAH4164824.1 hypothetical protein HBH43_145960 [Parastagonospora nodorum]
MRTSLKALKGLIVDGGGKVMDQNGGIVGHLPEDFVPARFVGADVDAKRREFEEWLSGLDEEDRKHYFELTAMDMDMDASQKGDAKTLLAFSYLHDELSRLTIDLNALERELKNRKAVADCRQLVIGLAGSELSQQLNSASALEALTALHEAISKMEG